MCSTTGALRRFFTGLVFADAEFDGISTGAEPGATTGGAEATAEPGAGAAPGAITVNLTGAEEVPGPGDEDASGTATVYLRSDSNEVCVDITVQNITLPASAAHIHQAPAGQAGSPVVPLTAPDANGVSNTCATVEATLMQAMLNNPENFYVNVHNADFPDGAARGQMELNRHTSEANQYAPHPGRIRYEQRERNLIMISARSRSRSRFTDDLQRRCA
jgi:hypothetical protein